MNRRSLFALAAAAAAAPRAFAQHRQADRASLRDFASVESAAASGVPVYCPPGLYTHGTLTLASGTEFYGSRQAVFQIDAPDIAGFQARGIAYFRIAGITIRGRTDATGVTGLPHRAAIVVSDCDDFMVEDCAFVQHAGSGLTIGRQGSFVRRGVVRNNTFIKGDMSAAATPYGTQDCAPVQVYQHSRHIEVYGNRASGPWYCGFLAQDLIGSGASRIHGLKVHDNHWEALSNYGIVLYTRASLRVTRIGANGAGGLRVATHEPHGVLQGEAVHLSDCGRADGIWATTAISPTELDLVGSAHATDVALGILSLSESCAGQFHHNVIDGIDGSREYAPGNKPYGAGLYVQSAGGVFAHNNVFRRTNLQTNSETLTPASIGISSPTGTVQVTGGSAIDSGRTAVSVKCGKAHGPVFIGGGLQIVRPRGDAIRLHSPRNVTLDGIDVTVSADSSSGRLRSDAAGSHVAIRNVKMRDFNVAAASNAIEIHSIEHFEFTGNSVNSTKPAGAVFEAVKFSGCSRGTIAHNAMLGGLSAHTALSIRATTHTAVDNNRIQMSPDSAGRETVSLSGVCTGTVYSNSNDHAGGRMANTSSGGAMHTREANNSSGGKVRQPGDTITNTRPGAGGIAVWIKTAASAGPLDWQALKPS
jgi:hypothetical protein